jgi:hypothetical protein
METEEAVAIIRAIADSLAHDPSQFDWSVMVVGQKIVSHGGTGLVATATGGAPGSQATGNFASASAPISIDIERASAGRIAEATQEIRDALDDLATAVEQKQSEPAVNGLLARLRGLQMFPTMIGDVAAAALSMADVVHQIT